MSNWCNNTLTVVGPEKEINNFRKQVLPKKQDKDDLTDLSLETLLPCPDELESPPDESSMTPQQKGARTKMLFKKYGAPIFGADKKMDWYYWQIKFWGTKWDIRAAIVVDLPRRIVYQFESAWSPPCEWLKAIAPKFPALKFTLRYEEGGMGFKGKTKAHGNEYDDQCVNL